MLVRLTKEDSSSQKTDRFQAPLPPLLLYFSSTQMATSAPSLSLRWLESFTIWINIKIELSKDIFQFLQTNDHVHSRDHYHLDLVFWKPPGVRSGRRSCASSGPQTRCTCSSQTPWWPIQIISLAEVSVKRTIFSVSFLTLYSWLWKRQDDQELCETVNTNWKKDLFPSVRATRTWNFPSQKGLKEVTFKGIRITISPARKFHLGQETVRHLLPVSPGGNLRRDNSSLSSLTRVIRWICLVLCNKHFFKLQSYIKLQMIIRPTDDKRT